MAKKQTTTDEPQKPTFDPADFLATDDEDEAPDNLDFGDELNGDEVDDDLSQNEPPETDEEPEEEPEAEEAEAEPEAEEAPEAEPEADGEPEPETADKGELETPPEKEKARGKPGHMVPKARLDQQIAKTKQYQDRIGELEKQAADAKKAAAEAAKIPDEQIQNWLQESAQKALDGETAEAAALQSKAFKAMNQNTQTAEEAAAPVDANQIREQVKEELKVDALVEKVFTDYPVLDVNSESFDEDMNNEVLDYQDFYLAKGFPASVAIERAVNMLAKTHDLKAVGQAEPEAPAPKTPDRDTKVPVKQKMKAAGQQPPEPSGRKGNKAAPEETVDISQLDDEQFAALPESVRARLRGD